MKTLLGHTSNISFLVVSQIQNLGYFPVKDLQLNIEIPEMTKNGNQLLQISDFHIDQVTVEFKAEFKADPLHSPHVFTLISLGVMSKYLETYGWMLGWWWG